MNDEKMNSQRKKKNGTLDWFVQKSKKNDVSSSQVPICVSSPTQPSATQVEQEFSFPSNNMPQTQETEMRSTCIAQDDSTTFASREVKSQVNDISIPHDPAKRKKFIDYHPMDRETVRKEYIQRGACQPKKHKFPQTNFGGGLTFRGHDECDESSNKGNFLELLNLIAEKNDDVGNVVLKIAPKNNQMIAPLIQKELINCCAKETTKAIVEDLGKDYFGILVHASSDLSQKEQIALCFRYVDKKGMIKEWFLGIVHVGDTTSLSLKETIFSLLDEDSLSFSRIHGQGYDGASNMNGELNGLKTLIMRETQSVYYIHCFAHQLQLTLVVVFKKNKDCGWFFDTLGVLLNVVGSSCRRKDLLKGKQTEKL
ncbi:zinc finger MYM-type protein 1-like [Hibiscus syriacus]|uniref:zinc finger MYM-type protein 1-like n=1 Tax=Hibiscus syriacus TaxID=106335 RepID=UPI001920DDC0|nr:zinc finger MYM-type protein 1-like [Hibiscus syriacus]